MNTSASGRRTPLVSEPDIHIFDEEQTDGRVLRLLSLHPSGADGIQGAKDLSRPEFHVHQYSQHMVYAVMSAAPVLAPSTLLMLGLGAGVAVHDLALRFPQMRIDVVDINPRLFDHTHRHFFPLDLPNIRLFASDARVHVRSCATRYDIILCDIFGPAFEFPQYLLLDDFYCELRGLGARMVAVNSHNQLAKPLFELLLRQFDYVQSLAGNNAFLIASDAPLRRDFGAQELAGLKRQNIDAALIRECTVFMSSNRAAKQG